MHEELGLLMSQRWDSPCVAIDVEFPGFLRSTPRHASEEARYLDVKHNVDGLKMIQLGITLFDNRAAASSSSSWQINLADFDADVDPHSEPSVELLKKSGIDFDRFRREGVRGDELAELLPAALFGTPIGTRWITFHGLYDVAYLVKLITGRPLPGTLQGFLHLVRTILGPRVYDVKHIIRFCRPSCGEMGLVRLSRELGVEWDGEKHLAGHDSLLTALVFARMEEVFDWASKEEHAGVLYSLEMHCLQARRRMVAMPRFRRPPRLSPCAPPRQRRGARRVLAPRFLVV